jgi:hypothetical protein
MAFAASALPVLLTVASLGLGVGSAVMNTSATMAANNYQSQVLARNAQLMEMNAQRAVEASANQAQQQDQMTRALLGEQLATQSASGLKIGGKSQMLTRKSARELGRLDALNIRHQGDVEAFNFRQMANDATEEIKFKQQSNGYALASGFLDAGSAIVGGATNLSSQIPSLLGKAKVNSWSSRSYTANRNPSFRFAR